MGGGSSSLNGAKGEGPSPKEVAALKKALKAAHQKLKAKETQLAKAIGDLEEKQFALKVLASTPDDEEEQAGATAASEDGDDDEGEDEGAEEVAEVFAKVAPHGRLQSGYRDEDGVMQNLLIAKGVPKESLHTKLDSDPEGLSQDEFRAWLMSEIGMDAKEAFVESINLHTMLAAKLPDGTLGDPLSSVQNLTQAGVGKVCRAMALELGKALWAEVEKLKAANDVEDAEIAQGGLAQAGSFNTKFAMTPDDGEEMVFGKMDDFQGGLKARIGVPHPNIMAAIELEHTLRGDSHEEFTTDNYFLTTSPAAEYELVTDREQARARAAASQDGRRVLFYEEVLEMEEAAKAGLTEPEVVALILYTGPMYAKYNAVLRKHPKAIVLSNQGNQYVNTITAVVSGIKKLACVSPLPRDRTVYRGVAGRKLPKKFTLPDERGVCGGVELGLMSTTTRAKTALQYCKPGRGWSKKKTLPMLFRISLGAVDTGASLEFLSQYPEEQEILFPPLSFVERVGEIDTVRLNGMWVRVIPIDISVNDQSDTVETIVAQRRRMILTTADFAYHEVCRDLDNIDGSQRLASRLMADGAAKMQALELHPDDVNLGVREVGRRLLQRCRTDFEAFVSTQRDKENEDFNQDEMFLRILTDLLDYKDAALHKIDLYLSDRSLAITTIEERSLKVVRRMLLAKLKDDLKAARRSKNVGRIRSAAAMLAKETGRLVQSVDEMIDGRSVLGAATEDGDSAGIRLLIEAGANPNLEDDCDGRNALSLATELDDSDCVEELLKGGSDVNGANAVDQATALHTAAFEGHTEIADVLLRAKADVNAQHNEGWSPLHYAAMAGHEEVAQLLVDFGGAVDAPIFGDAAMTTPLHLAAAAGCTATAEVLLRAGARANNAEKDGNTALHMAAEHGHAAVVKLLLEHGEDPAATNMDGIHAALPTKLTDATPLMLAAFAGHEEACRELLQHAADANFQMEGHVTALHGAGWGGNVSIAKMLVAAKADVAAVAQDEAFAGTAAEVARKQGQVEVADYLESLQPRSKLKQPAHVTRSASSARRASARVT